MDQRFYHWRQAVEATLPNKAVRDEDVSVSCSILAPGHTYATVDAGEAYTFQDHTSLEQAKAFTSHIVTCWSGPSGPCAGWMKTTFDQLVRHLEIEYNETKLQKDDQLWSEFKALKELVESVHVCGYLGCGTWEHSHFCVIFKVDGRFVTFRGDFSGDNFFDTEYGQTDADGFYLYQTDV